MEQLDKFIDRIQPSQEILLKSQKEPMMRSSSRLKVTVKQQLTSPHCKHVTLVQCSGNGSPLPDLPHV